MTAKEFLIKEYELDNSESHYNKLDDEDVYKAMVGFAKLKVKEALEQASEKALILIKDNYSSDYTLKDSETVNYKSGGVYGVYSDECTKHNISVQKESILNSYNINEIK